METGAYFTSAWRTNFREMPARIVDEDGPVCVGNLVFQSGGGVFLSEEFIRTSGRWETFDADFCAIVDELIG